ncbi:MAG: glutamate 5-kinase, partial [Pseudonocardia sp.]|nr:glutamate 5-kinase [Pseudonocardia sp.]
MTLQEPGPAATGAPTTRALLGAARRVVVKVGSSSLTSLSGGIDPTRLDRLVDALAARRETGSQVVLVSSGAIAAGLAPLRLTRRPRDLATQQAAAAVGQLLLAQAYGASFARYGQAIGQVLLTADDMIRRANYRNAQRTLERLLGLDVLPVVNENDTVATDEIRVGDNDRLAALVAHLVGADALVLLSDVDGLYDGDPRRSGSRLVPEVDAPEDLGSVQIARPGHAALGRGGMATKITAAAMASASGIPVLLAGAGDVAAALHTAGPTVGTAFRPSGRRISARRFWLRHPADVRGRLVLDDGALPAVIGRRRSLLAAGIHGI